MNVFCAPEIGGPWGFSVGGEMFTLKSLCVFFVLRQGGANLANSPDMMCVYFCVFPFKETAHIF